MKKFISRTSWAVLGALFVSGCTAAPNAGATPQSKEEKIMVTWFRYHDDLVESIRCSKDSDRLRHNAEEAILARQGIVRDLSQYQYEGRMSKSDVDVWYEKLRIAVGTENIAYVDAHDRLTGRETSPQRR